MNGSSPMEPVIMERVVEGRGVTCHFFMGSELRLDCNRKFRRHRCEAEILRIVKVRTWIRTWLCRVAKCC